MSDFSFQTELLTTCARPRILLLLSGGKDSVCCLYLLAEHSDWEVEALFFKHHWGSVISHTEAIKHCQMLGILLHEIDYSDALQEKLEHFRMGRPCLTCKPLMYKQAISFALDNQFNWIATGDSGNDATTCARLDLFNRQQGDNRRFCSTYLAGEQGLELPHGLTVLRPLICSSSDDIEEFLKKQGISVKRNFSTGDKYFDYSREGCCLQFCDPGTTLSPSICNDLCRYNDHANHWGQEHQIRTSVHLPSTFIVTIPPGHENAVADDLESHGLPINRDRNTSILSNRYLTVAIEHYPDAEHSPEVFMFLLKRLSERMSLKTIISCEGMCFRAADDKIELLASFLGDALMLNIQYGAGLEDKSLRERIRTLCIEIFHTRAIGFMSLPSAPEGVY